MSEKLTEKFIREAEPGEYFDTLLPGFSLRVTQGAKSFCLMYRHHGVRRRLTIGSIKKFTITAAREVAREAMKLIALGRDPEGEKKRKDVVTFAELVESYYSKSTKKSAARERKRIDYDVMPLWKNRPIDSISSRDVVQMQNAIAERGAPVMANRVRSAVSTIFRFAVEESLLATNPVVGTRMPGKETERTRVLDEAEIRRLWIELEAEDEKYRVPFRLQLMLAMRPGEALGMKWSELDLEAATWTLAETKSGQSHVVPLPRAAVEMLGTIARTDVDRVWRYRRAVIGRPGREMWVDAGSVAAVGRHAFADACERAGITDAHPHDLRRTAATNLGRLGVDSRIISKLLNHREGGITKIYNRYDALDERRAALEKWSKELTRICGPRGEVVALRA